MQVFFLNVIVCMAFFIAGLSVTSESRQGVRVYIDTQTRCEYLVSQQSITPRIDSDYMHAGCADTEFDGEIEE